MYWTISTSNKPDVLWQANATGRSNNLCIEFIESTDTAPKVNYQTILIDLAKWDEYWKQDACNFVPEVIEHFPKDCCQTESAYQSALAMHRKKIERWQKEVPKTGRVPAVCFETSLVNHRLKIKQGRHRIAYLRQIKLPVFAAAIPIDCIAALHCNQLHYHLSPSPHVGRSLSVMQTCPVTNQTGSFSQRTTKSAKIRPLIINGDSHETS